MEHNKNTTSSEGETLDCRLSRGEWLWVLTAAFASLALKLVFATQRGFWLDEYYTLHAASLPFPELVADRLAAGHSPLPFLYAKCFLLFFGDGEFALRASGTVGAFAAVIGCAMLLAELGLKRALRPLLLLSVFVPFWQEVGTDFRYTMPLIALNIFWALSVLRVWRRFNWGGAAVATILGALALWTHGSAHFVAVALFSCLVLTELFHPRGERNWKRAMRGTASIAFAVLLSVPLLIALGQSKESAGERSGPRVHDLIKNQARAYFAEEEVTATLVGQSNDPVMGCFIAVTLIALVISGAALWRERRHSAIAFAVAVLVVLPVCIGAYSMVAKDLQRIPRYVAFAAVPLLLLFAIAWTESMRWRFPRQLAFLVPMIVVTLTAAVASTLNQGDWHRETIWYIRDHRRAEEPIVTMGKRMNLLAMEYHRVPLEGHIEGVADTGDPLAALTEAIREAATQGPLVYVLLYHDGKVKVGRGLDQLVAEGAVRSYRIEQPTERVRLALVAVNEEGEARLAELPAVPKPWFSEEMIEAP